MTVKNERIAAKCEELMKICQEDMDVEPGTNNCVLLCVLGDNGPFVKAMYGTARAGAIAMGVMAKQLVDCIPASKKDEYTELLNQAIAIALTVEG